MMKTATIADLRNHFPKVFRWIEEGESVNLTKRGKVVAQLIPKRPEPPKKVEWPDFEAIQREVFGENYKERFFDKNIVLEERESYDR
jgi:antitoxin (DNA-binding transcriptional repressor) of toxin-antitoxin stability system